MRFILTAMLSLLGFSLYAQENSESSFGKGLVNYVARDSTFSIKMGARFQGQYSSNWLTGDGTTRLNGSNFLIRRARLKFDGFAYKPELRYKLQLGFSNRDISGSSDFTSDAERLLLDAVLKWNFHGNWDLWGGQTKLPGNREELISSSGLQFVDRSLLNSFFGLGREMGMQLHHQFDAGEVVIRESLSVSQGEGRNVTTGNFGGLHYLGKLEVLPLGEFIDEGEYEGGDLSRHPEPKLALGVSYSFNHDAVRSESVGGDYLYIDDGFYQTDISTFFVDAMFKYQGFSFMGEYARRKAQDPWVRFSNGILTGDVIAEGSAVNMQAGYIFGRDYELSGRFTRVDMKHESDQTQYTLGLSKYIVGHKLKVQTDLSYTRFEDVPQDDVMLRLQFEIHL